MSTLLIKRLARSLWRTKLRLFAVVAMVAIGVMAGISFGSYAQSAERLYDHIYADTEDGVNLPDIWVENTGLTWDAEASAELCQRFADSWPDESLPLEDCEPRLQLDGLLFHTGEEGEERLVAATWHGFDEGRIHRVWMPEHDTVRGRIAETPNEVVIDAHAAEALQIEVGTTVSLGAGGGQHDFTVVGIGYHAAHLYFAEEGSIFPANEGSMVTGYLTAEGLERLSGYDPGTANFLLLDVEGTPDYDLQSTAETEGPELAAIVQTLSTMVGTEAESPVRVYDRSSVQSVEFLRADAEGAKVTFPYITGMLILIAGITIFLSLQRLIQSQAREIAILRTLGIGRKTIMPAYVVAPVVIGAIGAGIGLLLGLYVGAPGMRSMYEDIIGVPVVVDGMDGALITQILGIALGIVFLSGIRPAWNASRLQPLEVLRDQHEIRMGSRRIQKLTSKLPTTIGLTLRSSLRKPMRLCLTFFGVGLSMLLFGSMLVMMGAMDSMLEDGFTSKSGWDAQVQVLPGQDQEVIAWAEQRGAAHELLLQYPASPEGDPRQLLVIGHDTVSTDLDTSMSIVHLGEGRLPEAGQEPVEVLIDEGTAMFLDWEIGDQEEIRFGEEGKAIEIVGITQDEMSRAVHLTRSDLAETLGIEATTVMLRLPENVEPDAALGAISTGITLRQDTIDTFSQLMDQQKQAFDAMIFMGILIAAVVLFNTLLMNLSERDKELATLRVLGAPLGRLGWMMFLEHLLIGIIGGAIGCIFSVLGAQAMIEASVQWAFYFTVEADRGALVTIMLTVTLISVALTPFGMWRIRKMDLVEKVKAH